jgi:PAS domain S-box-containing protein
MNQATDFIFAIDDEKIRSLVNHIPGAIYRCRGDEDITLEFFSEGVERLTGYPISYFMQNRISGYSNLVYKEDREKFLQNDRHALMEKGRFEIEYRIVRNDGEIKWVFESGIVNYGNSEDEVFIDGYIFDITQRKKIEADLKKSEDEVRRLALVAHNTTNSVMVTDAAENIVWINEGYTRISGFAPEEIQGKKIGYSLLKEGGDTTAYQRIRGFLDKKIPFKEEFISYTKTGEPIWLEVDCQPLQDEHGTHLGFMAVENDITQRKQTLKEQEELVQRLTLATDSAEIGIFEIDLATNDVIWDDKMYEIYGCRKDQGLSLYKVFFSSVHPDDRTMMANIINELLAQKKEIDGAIYRIIIPGGDVKYIESHAIIKKSDSGRIMSLIGTNRDVTADVLVQEKIKSQNKVLRDIAFIQSHEVRRPLANILGVIEILQQTGTLNGLEIFDLLIESANELDQQIRAIVNKANDMDDEVFR